MNPSRTYTPRVRRFIGLYFLRSCLIVQGAVGIAGLVAAIYPVESPGGYQLFGRTLSTWHPWGKGANFQADKPWLLNPFDQVSSIRTSHSKLQTSDTFVRYSSSPCRRRYMNRLGYFATSQRG